MIVAIPSKGRAGRVTTETVLSGADCTVFCPAAEAPDYEKHHRRVVPVPDSVLGITATRNWILDYAREHGERHVVQCDDDASNFQKCEGIPPRHLGLENPNHATLFENHFQMCEDAHTNLFGYRVCSDPQAYNSYSPFSFLSVIVGNFMGIIEDGQRFDARLKVKEDYDFSLQSLYRHRRVIRFNKYEFIVSHWFDPGGCAAYRSYETELNAIRILRQKWGGYIIQKHPKRNYEITVRPPLKGI